MICYTRLFSVRNLFTLRIHIVFDLCLHNCMFFPPPHFQLFACMPTYTHRIHSLLEVQYLLDIGAISSWFSTGSEYTLDIHMVYERIFHWMIHSLLLRYTVSLRGIWLQRYRYTALDTGYRPTFLLMVYTALLSCNCHPPGILLLFLWHTLHLHQQGGYIPDYHSYTRYSRAILSVNIIF